MVYHYDLDMGSFDFSDLSYRLQELWRAIEHFIESPSFGGFLAAFGIVAFICFLVGSAVGILRLIANWMLFDKAKQPGWAAIIPFFNDYTLYKMTWGSGWYFLLLLIPIVNVVIAIITMVKLSKAFGKGGGWACGLIFLPTVFLCITAFDSSIQYVGAYPGDYGTYTSDGQSSGFYKGDDYTGAASRPAGGKFCPDCGSPLNDGDKFCMHCGKQL